MSQPWGQRIRWILLLVVCGYLLSGLYLWWRNFPVNNVRIYGQYHHTGAPIIEKTLSGTFIKTPGFWVVSLSALQRSLQALPWIKSATVIRHRLGVLDVKLEEREVAARWGDHALIDEQGELFKPSVLPSDLKKLVKLTGPESLRTEIWTQYQQFSGILQAIRVKIREFKVSSQHVWCLELDTGTEVLLPPKHASEALSRFARVYDMILGEHAEHALRVDLRYAHGMAVAWAEGHKKSPN